MSVMARKYISLTLCCVLQSCVLQIAYAAADSQCTLERLRNTTLLGILTQDSMRTEGQASNPAVTVMGYKIVCAGTDVVFGNKRDASVVIRYNLDGGASITSQIEFGCDVGLDDWTATVMGSSAGNVQTPAVANLTSTLREDCAFCVNPDRVVSSAEHHCVSCHADCDEGLMQCSSTAAGSCCSVVENGMCRPECASQRVPGADFFCRFQCPPLTPATNVTITYDPVGCNATNFEGCVAVYGCKVLNRMVGGIQRRICKPKGDNTGGEWNGTAPMCVFDVAATPPTTTFDVNSTLTPSSSDGVIPLGAIIGIVIAVVVVAMVLTTVITVIIVVVKHKKSKVPFKE